MAPAAEPTAIAIPGTKEMALQPADHMAQIIALASNPAMDVDKLQRLIDMAKDIKQSDAVAAFNRAFAALQADIPTVIEKGKGDKGMRYATLEDIVETVRPVLQRHGFSLSHQTEWPDKATVKVIGILTHCDGHERRSEFLASSDTSGSKNAIQALGSSNSYGRRYTTKDLLNIVTKHEDDDGKKAGKTAAPDGFDDWIKHLEDTAPSGLKALAAAWECSDVAYRKHIRVVDWEALKKIAKDADAKAKAAKDA